MTNYILILVGLLVFAILSTIIITKVPKSKIAFQILLPVVIVVLGIYLYDGIKKPLDFEKAKQKRYDAVVERLIDIRNAQVAYKTVNGKYTGSFDTLVSFLKTDSLPVILKVGTVPDSLTDLMSLKDAEKEALKLGIIRRDTTNISVLDSLFKDKKYPVDELAVVPNAGGAKFTMGAGVVQTASKVEVPVFEAKVHNNVYLKELIGEYRQLIINYNDEMKTLNKYQGLKVGSLEEATNNAGNWE